jgi:hypothetical protein
VNTTSAAVSFTISNLGDVASSNVTYAFLGKGFGIVAPNPCTGPVQPGAPCTFKMTFTPTTAAGATSATLTASATTGGSSTTKLQGTALWVVTVTVRNDPSPNAPCGTLVIGGNVTSAPAGVNCTMTANPVTGANTGPNTCTAYFANNAALTFTETGSNFESWVGCVTPAGVPPNVPQCTLTVTQDAAVTATWCGPIP